MFRNPTLTDSIVIMHLLKYLPIAALSAMSLSALAQQPARVSGNAPPRLERLEEGEAPGITIRKPDAGTKPTEQRSAGKVKQIKVQSGGSTYYVKPNEQAGNAMPGDAESNVTRPAQFQVFEFDMGQRKQAREKDGAQTLEPAPPPPLVPAGR